MLALTPAREQVILLKAERCDTAEKRVVEVLADHDETCGKLAHAEDLIVRLTLALDDKQQMIDLLHQVIADMERLLGYETVPFPALVWSETSIDDEEVTGG